MPNKLYVGNLPWSTDSEALRVAFEAFGEIEEAKVITDRETGRSRGFGFVTYVNDDDAEKSLELDGSEMDGRPIRVSFARERKPRSDGGGYGRY